MLKQLLQASGDLEEELKAKYDDSLQGSTRLYSPEYAELFKAQATTIKTVYLVIDGLDSYQNTPEEETQQVMQNVLKTLPDSIRVIFTSRNDSVGIGVGADQKLSITPKEQDVKTYIEKRIEDSISLRYALKKKEDRDNVVRKVADLTLSSKMFLSARLHMDNLSKQGTLNDIKKALGELPDSAFKIFDASAGQIAQKINLRGNEFLGCLAKHILTWVIHAKTELTAEQICESFAIRKSDGQSYQGGRPAKELLMPACNGLVIMDPNDETLKLVHKSVQKYLKNHGIISENANLEIAKTCLSYLVIDTCDQESEPPLLQYAAKYWYAHLGCQGQGVDSEVESLILKFLRDRPKLAKAFKAIEGTESDAFDHMTGLHAAVHFNLLYWAKRLLKEEIDVNAQCSDGQTALHWAVRYRRHELLELLIENSANPNIRDHAGDTPLHKALMGPTDDKSQLHHAIISSTNDVNIVEALVKGNAQLDIRNSRGLSPMSSAIRYGPTSIAKVMVESQEDVDAEIFREWTSLRQVFYHGHDILESGAKDQEGRRAGAEGWAQLQDAVSNHARLLTDVLLKRGVNLNRPSAVDGWTPLLHAARTGDLSKLSRLLMRRPNPADVHLADPEGKTPLWWAIFYKKAAVIQLLAEHGADFNEVYNDGSTPLLEAIKQRDGDMVQLLIRMGADVNMKMESRSTFLIEAIKLRDHDTVWVLLNAKAALGGRDASGRSALLYAVENQDKALTWLLVAKSELAMGSNKSISSEDMQEALELAMTCDGLSVAWLLCEHGASPSGADDKGSTLLHRAVKNRNYKAVQFLVERGGTVGIQDATGSTPLHYAVLSDQDDLTDLLASRRSGLDILDAQGNTAFILATIKKWPTAMQTLLQYGASCNIADSDGLTALHHAAALGFNEGLSLILDRNFDGNPSATDDKHFTPLHHAVNGAYADPETVRVLVKAGAKMEEQDKDERTPLMLAAQLGREELVRSLLTEGADAQTRNSSGWTAVSYANNFPGIRKLLLTNRDR